jgi:predicted dehydrogenase
MGIKIGVTGYGQFARSFIPLFQAHPFVDEVAVADLLPERLDEVKNRFQVKRTFSSHEKLCESDVDAIAIFTQRHLHAPQTMQALKAGKHVYCCVPMAQTLEEIREIIKAADDERLIYMTGETSYYHPSAIYCRERFQKGDFGHFVYGEAQYIHDMRHGFYDAFKYSGGADWKKVAGFPPMFYPTHSAGLILSVTGARATHVSCLGYEDRHEDGIFREGGNLWNNRFSNETALIRTSDGGMCRMNEFRRAGWVGRNSGVLMSMFGTEGSFEEHGGGAQTWATVRKDEREDLVDLLDSRAKKVDAKDRDLHEELQKDFHQGVSKIHPVDRLPETFKGLNNGHLGSHQFLADDFVKSVAFHRLPPNHAWNAAKYCAPGLVAHESALREGTMMEIPDFGTPPAHWEMLDPYQTEQGFVRKG